MILKLMVAANEQKRYNNELLTYMVKPLSFCGAGTLRKEKKWLNEVSNLSWGKIDCFSRISRFFFFAINAKSEI